jgi:hypothetical protein
MKFRVCYWHGEDDDGYDNHQVNLDGTKEFPKIENMSSKQELSYCKALQKIVSKYEDIIGVIDQGGDADWQEFDCLDLCTFEPKEADKLAKQFLDEVEKKVSLALKKKK